jgi:hypothetical protein
VGRGSALLHVLTSPWVASIGLALESSVGCPGNQ